jgi:hypothetical protein
MFIKGISHQLELIASVFFLFIFCQHIGTREAFKISGEIGRLMLYLVKNKGTKNSTVINEYQLATLYIV